MKIIAMIPARLGSNRLKEKNLLSINGESLVSICLKKCLKADCFTEVYLNTESDLIARQAPKDCKVFMRDPIIANSTATSEDFVRDFLEKHSCDYLFQIHTIAPLLTIEEINNFVRKFINSGEQVGLCYEKIVLETMNSENKPINFSFHKKENSQDLDELRKINWCMTGWKVKDLFKQDCLSYCEGRYFHEVSKLTGFVIKEMEDYTICKKLMEKKC